MKQQNMVMKKQAVNEIKKLVGTMEEMRGAIVECRMLFNQMAERVTILEAAMVEFEEWKEKIK